MHSSKELSMNENTLQHHGIKGQQWGVRRFQDKTGKRIKQGLEERKKARDEYKANYKKNLETVNASSSTLEKAFISGAARKRAARIMTKNKDVTLKEAKVKATTQELAITLGAYGAITIASMYGVKKFLDGD